MNEPESGIPPTAATEPPSPVERPAPVAGALPAAGPSPAVATADRRAQLEQEFQDVGRICVFYGAMLLPILVVTGWSYHTENDDLALEFVGSIALYAAILGFALAWRREWTQLMRWPAGWSRGLLVLTIVTPLCTLPAAHLLCWWVGSIGLPVVDLSTGYGADGYPVWLLFLFVGVLPPIFEEIAFRGVLLSKLQRLMSPAHAVWVAAVLFGILHFSVLSMAVFLVPLAAVAGYITRRTGSLLPAILIHAIHNTGAILVDLLQ